MNREERELGDGEENDQQQQGTATNVKSNTKTLSNWKVDEELLKELINLGIDKNTAKKAIYYTSVHSMESDVEQCMNWIFSNQNPNELSKTTLEEELGLEEVYQLCPELSLDDLANEDYKMVFVINTSLNMSLGKSCSQTAHAALAIVDEITKEPHLRGYNNWILNGQTKIVLCGDSTQQLDQLKEKADNLGLATEIIQDAGRTEIAPGSKTVLAIFGPISTVDKVTGKLKLLK